MEIAALNGGYACSTIILARIGMEYGTESQDESEWEDGQVDNFESFVNRISAVFVNYVEHSGEYTSKDKVAWVMTSCSEGQDQEKEWLEKFGFEFTPNAFRNSAHTDSGVVKVSHGFMPYTKFLEVTEVKVGEWAS